jgi:hypothetical protein
MPVIALIIRALLSYYLYYGTISRSSAHGFRKDDEPLRGEQRDRQPAYPIFLGMKKEDDRCMGDGEVPERSPLARHILFYEYFHGDNGAGLGASHQTG